MREKPEPPPGASIEVISGRRSEHIPVRRFLDEVGRYAAAHFDLGTGDGMFVLRTARKNPGILVVAVDADRASLAVGSSKAARKPTRGGCSNALYVCADALALPEFFQELADRISLNFPWGRLLAAACRPDPAFLLSLRRLLKPAGRLEIFLNTHVFEDEALRENLSLPALDEEYVTDFLLGAYRRHGLEPLEWAFLAAQDLKGVPSTWAGRLVRGSGRTTFRLLCETRA